MGDERESLSTPDIVRSCMRQIGDELLVAILPSLKTTAPMVGAGTSEDLPTMVIEWATPEPYDVNPVDESVTPDGRGIWCLHREEAKAAFKFFCRTPEDADFIAKHFVRMLKRRARESNDEGASVLHFVVDASGVRRTGKLYVAGGVQPIRGDDELTRSLYAFRVPVVADYPVMDIDDRKTVGLLNIVVEVNGRKIALNNVRA